MHCFLNDITKQSPSISRVIKLSQASYITVTETWNSFSHWIYSYLSGDTHACRYRDNNVSFNVA